MANLSNNVNSVGNSLNSTVDKAKSALNSGLANIDPATVNQLNHFKDEALDKAAVFYEQSEKYVRRNPFYFIGGAAILGCLAGMLVSRRD
jgi:ElaB/YqjD/DUF883 family membrane-anchored ribosome-binding protein